jgi:cytochrome c553
MRQHCLTRPLAIPFVLIGFVSPPSVAWADARAGEKKAQLCLLCHRVEASLGAPTLEQQPTRYLIAQTNAFKSGKRPGPEMQSNVARLSARDIRDIADYFASQRARPARFAVEPDAKTLASGEASAGAMKCASCHGDGYRGAKDAPRLAGQVPAYLARSIAEFKRGVRKHPALSPASEKLDDATMDALGAYFGKLEP